MTDQLPELDVEVVTIVRRDGEEIDVYTDGLTTDTAIALCSHAIAILTRLEHDDEIIVEADDDGPA